MSDGLVRMKRVFAGLVGLLCIGLVVWGIRYATAPAYDGHAGITYAKAFAADHNADIDFHIWYPAEPGGRAVTVGGNGVFWGTKAGKDAPHRAGRFPLVLISHGSGGNAGQFGWIAQALADQGFVVALPNHPGTTSGNASAAAALKVWTRPGDLSAVIDAIIAHPETYPYVDTSRIAALGFSAGGYTAMAVAGAIVVPERLNSFCDDGKTGMSDCTFLARGGVDLHSFDFSPAAKDHRDPRITAAVIIDPGIVTTLTDDSLRAITIPMLIINLGQGDAIPRAVYAKPAADLIPKATYQTIPDAIHFTFLAECKAKGAQILKDEDEIDPLCDDAGGRSRAELHADLQGRIVSYLTQVFGQ